MPEAVKVKLPEAAQVELPEAAQVALPKAAKVAVSLAQDRLEPPPARAQAGSAVAALRPQPQARRQSDKQRQCAISTVATACLEVPP